MGKEPLYIENMRRLINEALVNKNVQNRKDAHGVINEVLSKYITDNKRDFRGAGLRRKYTFNTKDNTFNYYDHDALGQSVSGSFNMDHFISPEMNTQFRILEKKEEDTRKLEEQKAAVRAKYPNLMKMEEASLEGRRKYRDLRDKISERNYDLNKMVTLKSGKFNNTKVPIELLNEIAEQADAAGLDRKTAFGLIGQESTFGVGKNPGSNTLRKNHGYENAYNPDAIASYWLGSRYIPKPLNHLDYLSRRNGSVVEDKENTDKHYYKLMIPKTEKDSMHNENLLAKNPKLLENYMKQLKAYDYNIQNPYKDAFEYYQTGNYNVNDENHTRDVNNSANILSKDPVIKNYLK